jgi:hypothetical protein
MNLQDGKPSLRSKQPTSEHSSAAVDSLSSTAYNSRSTTTCTPFPLANSVPPHPATHQHIRKSQLFNPNQAISLSSQPREQKTKQASINASPPVYRRLAQSPRPSLQKHAKGDECVARVPMTANKYLQQTGLLEILTVAESP